MNFLLLLVVFVCIHASLGQFNIGTKQLFGDKSKTLWEMVLEPGEVAPFHRHLHDYLFYVVEGSELEVLDEHGTAINSFVAAAGDVISFTLDESGELLHPSNGMGPIPAAHGARNIGGTRCVQAPNTRSLRV